ncbi:MAG: zinc ribbon domain-containing protein [Dehalococcoidia bacterium]|nr:zinc ribbon domain-containing protein [Dehalococcoidia bacterium]
MESIVAFIITALALGFVGLPLFRERKPEEGLAYDAEYADSEVGRLLGKKDTAITALRELEFDHAVGSLSDDDYSELRDKYEKKAISLLKTLDDVSEAEAKGQRKGSDRRTVQEGRNRRGKKREMIGPACAECGEPYEEGDQFCRICGAELSNNAESSPACPECGEPFEEGDIFCGACGFTLTVDSEASGPMEERLPVARTTRVAGEAAQNRPDGSPHRRRARHNRPGRTGGSGKDGR